MDFRDLCSLSRLRLNESHSLPPDRVNFDVEAKGIRKRAVTNDTAQGHIPLENQRRRFRPIVMTRLTTVMGSLPLVISSGAGGGQRSESPGQGAESFTRFRSLFVATPPPHFSHHVRHTQTPPVSEAIHWSRFLRGVSNISNPCGRIHRGTLSAHRTCPQEPQCLMGTLACETRNCA